MNIFALKGHLVKVTKNTKNNGYGGDKEQVAELLEIDKSYEVESTNVHSSSTSVRLSDFPGKIFNSVNFESLTNQPVDINRLN